MIDLHCHLDLYPNPSSVAAECIERSMYVLSLTTTPSAWQGTVALADGSERIRTAIGLHPQLAHERHSELPLFDKVLPETRYVGEVGLDGAPEFKRHWGAQLAVFNHVLQACERAGGRILSVHSRRATSAVLDRLEAVPEAGAPILHWFSGTTQELDRAIAIGCWFSVGPAMLCSERGRAIASRMPRNRVFTESDGPFATLNFEPVMPWQVDQAISALADLWSVPSTEVDSILHRNLRSLASLIPIPA